MKDMADPFTEYRQFLAATLCLCPLSPLAHSFICSHSPSREGVLSAPGIKQEAWLCSKSHSHLKLLIPQEPSSQSPVPTSRAQITHNLYFPSVSGPWRVYLVPKLDWVFLVSFLSFSLSVSVFLSSCLLNISSVIAMCSEWKGELPAF